MTVFVPLKDLEARLAQLAARVEAGETVVLTRDGEPVFDWTPHARGRAGGRTGQVDLEAGWAYLESIGVGDPFPSIADDFDDPLPEDFLLRSLPPG